MHGDGITVLRRGADSWRARPDVRVAGWARESPAVGARSPRGQRRAIRAAHVPSHGTHVLSALPCSQALRCDGDAVSQVSVRLRRAAHCVAAWLSARVGIYRWGRTCTPVQPNGAAAGGLSGMLERNPGEVSPRSHHAVGCVRRRSWPSRSVALAPRRSCGVRCAASRALYCPAPPTCPASLVPQHRDPSTTWLACRTTARSARARVRSRRHPPG